MIICTQAIQLIQTTNISPLQQATNALLCERYGTYGSNEKQNGTNRHKM